MTAQNIIKCPWLCFQWLACFLSHVSLSALELFNICFGVFLNFQGQEFQDLSLYQENSNKTEKPTKW